MLDRLSNPSAQLNIEQLNIELGVSKGTYQRHGTTVVDSDETQCSCTYNCGSTWRLSSFQAVATRAQSAYPQLTGACPIDQVLKSTFSCVGRSSKSSKISIEGMDGGWGQDVW